MRFGPSRAAELATTISLILLAFPLQSMAQTAAGPAASQIPGLQCNGTRILDPFKGSLAGPALPPGLLPIDDKDKSDILKSGLPCQENVFTERPKGDSAGTEATGLENLQRGFDFYSWRTFIALNAPADRSPIEQAQADTATLWEDVSSFKQLLDIMLPPGSKEPTWPPDAEGVKTEHERLVPKECRNQPQQRRDGMIVKMIEESFNEPFKTGPLIDQSGHYAIFDILMNRQMFKYIMDHNLNTKAGQARNSDLSVDFPAGQNQDPDKTPDPFIGAFMLKVSWKILSQSEIEAKNFHMVDALVLMPPPGDPIAGRQCLPEKLGLIGFHAVHKTVSRPQWIWTSFEHIKNVPDKDEVVAKKLDGPYNFFSVDCGDQCPVENATPPRPWDPDPALKLSFRKDNSFKSQIVRETPLTNAAKNMNTIFHSMLPNNSVWRHYMLISTQWPSAFACTSLHSASGVPAPHTDFVKQPDMTCSPAPTFLANSTLETYSQGDVPLASSSCIACHGNAVGFQQSASNRQPDKANLDQSDFTFMLEKAQ
jgi:hypothetical protein